MANPVAPAAHSLAAIHTAWDGIESRYAAYRLVVPGDPAFHCQPDLCDAHCCRAFTVNLGESEVARMQVSSHLAPLQFLESADGAPVTLPLAQPYILARTDNHCALLDAARHCSQYEGRPNACRLYPHFMLFADAQTGRPIHGDAVAIRQAVDNLHAGLPFDGAVPLLVRHIECPGFTGAPISPDDWLTLFNATFEAQFPANPSI